MRNITKRARISIQYSIEKADIFCFQNLMKYVGISVVIVIIISLYQNMMYYLENNFSKIFIDLSSFSIMLRRINHHHIKYMY